MAALEQSSRQGSVSLSRLLTVFHCDYEQNDKFIHRNDSFLTELISLVIIVFQSSRRE